MNDVQAIVMIIKGAPCSSKESNFTEHPDEFSLSFVLNMFLVLALTLSIVTVPYLVSGVFLWIQKKWKREVAT